MKGIGSRPGHFRNRPIKRMANGDVAVRQQATPPNKVKDMLK